MWHTVKRLGDVKHYNVVLLALMPETSSSAKRSCVSQLLLALNPCWQSVKMLYSSRCFRILLIQDVFLDLAAHTSLGNWSINPCMILKSMVSWFVARRASKDSHSRWSS